MFFLGLLSTPLPYLLLAAFYFFGFAMGVFNNSSDSEPAKTVTAVTIPAEVSPKTNDDFTFFYQVNPEISQNISEDIDLNFNKLKLFPDSGIIHYFVRSTKVNEIHFSGFLFSRPPPSAC